MRILICTKRDLPANLALNRLLEQLQGQRHEFLVFFSDKTRPAEVELAPLQQLKFLERDLPNRLLFPVLDREGAERRSRTFEELARLHGFDSHVIRSLKSTATIERMRSFAPDLIISIRFSFIFGTTHIEIPRHGIINLHPGPLPAHGGLFAPMRQMAAGGRTMGCTLHYVDEGIDTGPVIEISEMKMQRERSMLWHLLRLYQVGVPSIVRVVKQLEAGTNVPALLQNPALRQYHGMPTAQDLHAFAAQGLKLADTDEYLDTLLEEFGPEAARQALAFAAA